MQNPLLQKVDEIESWFKPNPFMAGDLLDPVFDLVRVQEPEQLVIEIRQFVFTRARIVIPHNERNAWLRTAGRCDIGGDLACLRNALVHDGYIKTKRESMLRLFTSAKKPKPNRRGASLSRSKKRRA